MLILDYLSLSFAVCQYCSLLFLLLAICKILLFLHMFDSSYQNLCSAWVGSICCYSTPLPLLCVDSSHILFLLSSPKAFLALYMSSKMILDAYHQGRSSNTYAHCTLIPGLPRKTQNSQALDRARFYSCKRGQSTFNFTTGHWSSMARRFYPTVNTGQLPCIYLSYATKLRTLSSPLRR